MKFRISKYLKKENAFLMDGIGALVSGIFLFFIIGNLESLFGIPAVTVKRLAILPFLFCIYSFSCHFIQPQAGIYLIIISALNFFYCIVSLTLMVIYFDKITPLGLFYFFSEKLIVIPLAIWEWKVSDCKKISI